MKTWLIALPLVCAAGVAMAEGIDKNQAAAQMQAGSIRHKVRHGMHKHRIKHFPKRDRRHCLDLKDNKAIIRCAETTGKP